MSSVEISALQSVLPEEFVHILEKTKSLRSEIDAYRKSELKRLQCNYSEEEDNFVMKTIKPLVDADDILMSIAQPLSEYCMFLVSENL